mmetsp:Transcript_19435/g.33068  ORF Transcript_19435/g.33068 Transcript_19435/m.33068 type:complete len:98 (+) Transcript_19435:488-781(+)
MMIKGSGRKSLHMNEALSETELKAEEDQIVVMKRFDNQQFQTDYLNQNEEALGSKSSIVRSNDTNLVDFFHDVLIVSVSSNHEGLRREPGPTGGSPS